MPTTQTRIYKDFNISFTPNLITGDVNMVTAFNSVVQAVMNLVQLNHYEKPFHPEIGGNIRRLLFEPADNITAGSIANEIKIVITNFEPRASLLGVYVETTPDSDGYNVTIEFSVLTVADPISINFFLERLR
jgi:phage baseplate assembly protein W